MALGAATARPVLSAQDAPPTVPPNPAADAAVERNQRQILGTLLRLERQYGRDAVLLSGYALSLAVRHGAVLEAEAKIGGIEEHQGARYLAVHLRSGIVFNDREHAAPQRPMRLWTNIVEPSLRQLPEDFQLPAPGVVFHIEYNHRPYTDELELRDHLAEGRGDGENARFYVLTTDIQALRAQRISPQELADRAIVLVNDGATRLTLEPTPEPKRLQPPGEL